MASPRQNRQISAASPGATGIVFAGARAAEAFAANGAHELYAAIHGGEVLVSTAGGAT